ncbi:Uncharacterised protein [Mycobacterium tuberculosis]|nr:Uncharacterised protein [Mycobacterium tuberculosis]
MVICHNDYLLRLPEFSQPLTSLGHTTFFNLNIIRMVRNIDSDFHRRVSLSLLVFFC